MTHKNSVLAKKDYNYWVKVNHFSKKLYGSIIMVEILGFLLCMLFLLTFILEA